MCAWRLAQGLALRPRKGTFSHPPRMIIVIVDRGEDVFSMVTRAGGSWAEGVLMRAGPLPWNPPPCRMWRPQALEYPCPLLDQCELLCGARLDFLVPLGKLCPHFSAWEPLPSASFPVLLPVSLPLRGLLHFAMNPVLRMAVS